MREGATGISRFCVGWAMLGLLSAAPGCMQYGAMLDADSYTEAPGHFDPHPQYVHVGEKFRVKFRVQPYSMDNYAIFELPGETRVVPANHDYANYNFTLQFPHASPPQGVLLKATGYRTRGRQDVMMIGGKISRQMAPDDPPDERLASDEIRFIVYQSRVRFPDVGGKDFTPDWAATKLVIEAERVEFDDPYQPGRLVRRTTEVRRNGAPGFTVDGPDRQGRYTVTYLPKAEQVNRGGTTPATLYLVDSAGATRKYAVEFSTW